MNLAGTGILDTTADLRATIEPPRWAVDCVAGDSTIEQNINGLRVTSVATPMASLITVCAANAGELEADAFEQSVVDAYAAIRSALDALPAREPVRFWNHLPSIHQSMDADRDRYMVFNAGRFRAFADRLGGAEQFDGRIPTASGVGHGGNELVIFCLAATQAGRAVENPRQIPAFKYSRRYGPRPPCFARATVVDDLLPGGPAILVGGTASICGERSVHQDELTAQIDETLANLASLVQAAGVCGAPLASFTDVRVYYPRPADAGAIQRRLTAAFPVVPQLVHADLCRAELLVEIEGVARLPRSGSDSHAS